MIQSQDYDNTGYEVFIKVSEDNAKKELVCIGSPEEVYSYLALLDENIIWKTYTKFKELNYAVALEVVAGENEGNLSAMGYANIILVKNNYKVFVALLKEEGYLAYYRDSNEENLKNNYRLFIEILRETGCIDSGQQNLTGINSKS